MNEKLYYLGTVSFIAEIITPKSTTKVEGQYTIPILASSAENARTAFMKHWEEVNNGATLVGIRITEPIIGE
jgi:hypothetical protein